MVNVNISHRVWDIPIRLIHWLLVGLLGFSWWSAEVGEMALHQYSGLALCALLLFRLIWGFIGSNTARFRHFLKGPRSVIAYLTSSGPWRGLGHNPVGGWSAIILLFMLASQVTTGLFAVDVDGIESGPLSYIVSFDQGRLSSGIHEINFNILLALASVHVIAIFYYLFVRKRNLIRPMVTGIVSDSEIEPSQQLAPAPIWRLGVSILISGSLTYAIARGFQF